MLRDSRESELKRNGVQEWVIPSVCQSVLVPPSLRRETAALKAVARLLSKMLERGDQLRTSTLPLGEVLVKPTERGESTLREV